MEATETTEPLLGDLIGADTRGNIKRYKATKCATLGPDSARNIRDALNNPFTARQELLNDIQCAMCNIFNVRASRSMRINVMLDGFFLTNKHRNLHIIMTTKAQPNTNPTFEIFLGKFAYNNLMPHTSHDIIRLLMR